jgi:hypothetical protein
MKYKVHGRLLAICLLLSKIVWAAEAEPTLLDLAKEAFRNEPLTKAETQLVEAADNGNVADYTAESICERQIRASVIRWLCIDRESVKRVTSLGISVGGARIEGRLDLQFAEIPFPLRFEGCEFTDEIDLPHADIRLLSLQNSSTKGITADGLKVSRGLFLRGGFKSEGEVRLLGAAIGGNLECDRATIINTNRPGKALSAEGLKVDGSVFLRDGFTAEGEVRFMGAVVGGNVECDGGRFNNSGFYALKADGIKVEGAVRLQKNFIAAGEVSLVGAQINGDLDCEGGQFINNTNNCLSLAGATIKQNVILANGFRAEGRVDLRDAIIGLNLHCEQGSFLNHAVYDPRDNESGIAILAYGLNVGHCIFMSSGFQAEGRVRLVSASIGRYFIWTGVHAPERCSLDLRAAKVGTLWDEEKSWPMNGNLILHGFVYDLIEDRSPTKASERLRWLNLQPKKQFLSQSYEQLSSVLRREGYEDDARQISIAKNDNPALLEHMRWYERVVHWISGKLIGYGYQPWRAFIISLVVIAVGAIVFHLGYLFNCITPTEETAGTADLGGKTLPLQKTYPKFNALIYSLEAFTPLVNLYQNAFWLPDADAHFDLKVGQSELKISGHFFRLYFWSHIIAGWVLTTFWVGGLTGLIKN